MNKGMAVLAWTLAAYRVSHLVTRESGPWRCFDRMREYLWNRGFLTLYELVNCFFCFSLWVCLVPAVFLAPTVKDFFVLWLSIGGAVLIMDKLTNREEK
jgi:hypothetical protein